MASILIVLAVLAIAFVIVALRAKPCPPTLLPGYGPRDEVKHPTPTDIS